MTDERIRELRRRWLAGGTVADWLVYERELERAGLLPVEEPEPEPVPPRLGRRDRVLETRILDFVHRYGRSRGRGVDPGVGWGDRRFEIELRRMDPETLDAFLNGEPRAGR